MRIERRRSELVWALSYLVLVAALVSLASYTRTVDRSAQECVTAALDLITKQTTAKSDAADRKDRAELARLENQRMMFELLVLPPGQRPTEEDRARAYALERAYDLASREYEVELKTVLEVRSKNRPPNYQTFCRDLRKTR